MQDRDKIDEVQDTTNTAKEMQEINTRGLGKTKQMEEAETAEQKQKGNEGTAE